MEKGPTPSLRWKSPEKVTYLKAYFLQLNKYQEISPKDQIFLARWNLKKASWSRLARPFHLRKQLAWNNLSEERTVDLVTSATRDWPAFSNMLVHTKMPSGWQRN